MILLRFSTGCLVLLFGMQISFGQQRYDINREGAQTNLEPLKQAFTFLPEADRVRTLHWNRALQQEGVVIQGDTILLPLFSDTQFMGVVERIGSDINGVYTLRVRLVGEFFGSAFIATAEGVTSLLLDLPGRDQLFRTRQFNGINYLFEADKSKLDRLPGSEPLIPPLDREGLEKKNDEFNGSDADTTLPQRELIAAPLASHTIDVLVVYTPAAQSWSAANDGGISRTISLLMAKGQEVLDNSSTDIEFRLVHSALVSYSEANNIDDLNRLTNKNDGYLEEVHQLRYFYKADLVVFLASINFTGGVAWLLSSSAGQPAYGFSLTRVQQASWTTTGIHEVGHNMGASHHKLQKTQPGPGLYSYSAGWRWEGSDAKMYCSIMTYNRAEDFDDGKASIEVPIFSNPGVSYLGIPTGHANNGDNARTLRNVKAAISGYSSSLAATLPLAPTLSSPANAAVVQTLTPTLQWNSAMGADSYELMVASNSGFTAPEFSRTGIIGTTFVPTLTTSGTWYWRVRSTNGAGNSEWSASRSFTIAPLNQSPIANAGAAQTVRYGDIVVLDGSASTDPEGAALTYLWSAPSGITLSSNTAVSPTFTAPEVANQTVLTFSLVVNDGNSSSTPSSVNVTVRPVCRVIYTETICEGENFMEFTTTGVHYRLIPTTTSCDTLAVINLTVNQLLRRTEQIEICEGENYLGYTASGVYERQISNAVGCDSLVVTQLTVKPLLRRDEVVDICAGSSYLGYTASGIYERRISQPSGCDSLITTFLTVHPDYFFSESVTLCFDDTYYGLDASGVYERAFNTIFGCDSLVTTQLTILPKNETSEFVSLCAGESYLGYFESSVFERVLRSAFGCDSTVTTFLTVHPTYDVSESIAFCEGNSYEGFTTTGTYLRRLETIYGCDSLVTTLLTVHPIYYLEEEVDICPRTNYLGLESAGSYRRDLASIHQCDSVVMTHLSVYPSYEPRLLPSGNTLTVNLPFVDYLWFRYDLEIAGASGPLFAAKQSGEYSMTGIDQYGCEHPSEPFFLYYLMMAQPQELPFAYSVSPNPNDGFFRFRIESQPPAEVVLNLLTIDGNRLETHTLKQPQVNEVVTFNLRGRSSGLLMLQILSDGGMAVERIMYVMLR